MELWEEYLFKERAAIMIMLAVMGLATIEALQLDRFLLHLPIGSMPHEAVLHAIELFGTKVAPQVRKQIAYNRAQRLN